MDLRNAEDTPPPPATRGCVCTDEQDSKEGDEVRLPSQAEMEGGAGDEQEEGGVPPQLQVKQYDALTEDGLTL